MNKNENKAAKDGTLLLVLGVLSLFFGPLTAIPGLALSKRFRPFSAAAILGYVLCWSFLIIYVVIIVLVLGARVKH
jgi:ABC-type glucose/galactose transport system permease subunit